MAALALHCCMQAFSSHGKRGLQFLLVHRLLIAVASLCCGPRALGAWALLLHGMWDLPRPGIEPMSPAWAGGFLTTALPGKSTYIFIIVISSSCIDPLIIMECPSLSLATFFILKSILSDMNIATPAFF